MKRYVKEFAADRIKSLQYANEDVKQKALERINKVVNMCERSFVSDFEAVKQICNVIDDINGRA